MSRALAISLVLMLFSIGLARAGSDPARPPAAEAAPATPPAPPPPGSAAFDAVEVAHTKTSIYVGSVSLAMPTFRRTGSTYKSTYAAKAFPYFFYNEKGSLAIELPDADLARLAKGETVQFSGRAENSKGEPRRVEGRAVPENARQGKIKVRVFVTPKIELIFNTTYRFVAPPT